MAETDDNRVEARIGMTGRGLSATPERIEELQRQAEVTARMRAQPSQSFAAVLGKAQPQGADVPLSKKEARRAALPKKGPRPGLRHPDEEDTYGIAETSGKTVVLKG